MTDEQIFDVHAARKLIDNYISMGLPNYLLLEKVMGVVNNLVWEEQERAYEVGFQEGCEHAR